mmetsp:Transcript_63013/g.187515  ORF Transcript_63013/g.187515 Transcript_63013/m.187515 type:complete len:114 (-) Transcript_63013:432-773(-)
MGFYAQMLPFDERNKGLQFFSEGLQRTNFHELITVYLCDYSVNCRPISCRTVESDALGMGRTGTDEAPCGRQLLATLIGCRCSCLSTPSARVSKRLRRHHLRQQLRRAVRYPA